MKKWFFAASLPAFFGSISLLFLPPAASAGQWDLWTKVTFHQPVEIPHIVLGPGTYVMKLLDPGKGDGNVVQISNEKETKVYATILAIPAYREKTTDKTAFIFEERVADSPQAIKKWFYPGRNWGEEFVYPKAQQLAAAPAPPALQPRTPEAPAKPASQAVAAPTPSRESQPVEVAQAQPVAQPAAPSPSPAPAKELPKTASDIPLIALFGACFVSAGAFLRMRRA